MNAAIPESTVTAADLAEWYALQKQLGELKSKEALIRSRIFKHFFPNPTEGTNNFELKDGTGAVLKGKHTINRSVDVGSLDALRTSQTAAIKSRDEDGVVPNIPLLPLDDLIKWKPELALAEYRKLTEEERTYFDQALVIKDGAPALEITIPKRAKA